MRIDDMKNKIMESNVGIIALFDRHDPTDIDAMIQSIPSQIYKLKDITDKTIVPNGTILVADGRYIGELREKLLSDRSRSCIRIDRIEYDAWRRELSDQISILKKLSEICRVVLIGRYRVLIHVETHEDLDFDILPIDQCSIADIIDKEHGNINCRVPYGGWVLDGLEKWIYDYRCGSFSMKYSGMNKEISMDINFAPSYGNSDGYDVWNWGL